MKTYTHEELKGRLLARLRITDSGCWEWTGTLDGGGYGQIHYAGRKVKVHALAAYVFLGIPLGSTDILHSCDNKPCFRPEHIHAGTHRQNMIEAAMRGRNANKQKGVCRKGHPYDLKNTYTSKQGKRFCRSCQSLRMKERRGKGNRA